MRCSAQSRTRRSGRRTKSEAHTLRLSRDTCLPRTDARYPGHRAKDANFKTVVKALNAVKEGEIKSVVEQVHKTYGPTGTDTLMKYVFRGLAEVESCGTMLKWHGAVVEVAGLGPIVRGMTDRKTV